MLKKLKCVYIYITKWATKHIGGEMDGNNMLYLLCTSMLPLHLTDKFPHSKTTPSLPGKQTTFPSRNDSRVQLREARAQHYAQESHPKPFAGIPKPVVTVDE
jgi:hypothetical protein